MAAICAYCHEEFDDEEDRCSCDCGCSNDPECQCPACTEMDECEMCGHSLVSGQLLDGLCLDCFEEEMDEGNCY